MNKRIIGVFVAGAVFNLALVIGTFNFYYVAWKTQKTEVMDNNTEQEETTQVNSLVKYDFDMHVNYRLQVLQIEQSRLAQLDGCASVMTDPLSFWRSQPSKSTNFTAEIDMDRLKLANKCFMIPIADFFKTPPIPSQYSFETHYLSDPPLTKISQASNEKRSSVILLNSSSTFLIGDTVALLITMRDGAGNEKSKGGDEIRVWFTDVWNTKSVLPAKITDFNNGTYLATALLAFVGKFRTTVTLVYSREYIRTLIIAHLVIKSTTIYLGAFRNQNASEATVCSHVPVIPGVVDQSDVCNETVINGSPWYCGRPVKPILQCTDYVQTGMLPLMMTMPMNEAEKLLMNRFNKIMPITGSSNIELTVATGKGVTRMLSSEACNTIPARRTWEQAESTGYMYNGKWYSYLCRNSESVTKYCLPDLQILLLGDSNARAHFSYLSDRSSCKQQIFQEYNAWHKPLKCVNSEIRFTITWLPHSNPFKTTEFGWAGVDWITASNKAIDKIPSTGSYLVYLNHYLHTSSSHISAYVQLMTAIKESLVRLVQRNPNVFIVLQGPHVVWWFGAHSSYHMGDTLMRFITNIQFELFKDMRDRIFYIQTSDMTIATQNDKAHPVINKQIADLITGLFCGRH